MLENINFNSKSWIIKESFGYVHLNGLSPKLQEECSVHILSKHASILGAQWQFNTGFPVWLPIYQNPQSHHHPSPSSVFLTLGSRVLTSPQLDSKLPFLAICQLRASKGRLRHYSRPCINNGERGTQWHSAKYPGLHNCWKRVRTGIWAQKQSEPTAFKCELQKP